MLTRRGSDMDPFVERVEIDVVAIGEAWSRRRSLGLDGVGGPLRLEDRLGIAATDPLPGYCRS
jgi:hypothetical protein